MMSMQFKIYLRQTNWFSFAVYIKRGTQKALFKSMLVCPLHLLILFFFQSNTVLLFQYLWNCPSSGHLKYRTWHSSSNMPLCCWLLTLSFVEMHFPCYAPRFVVYISTVFSYGSVFLNFSTFKYFNLYTILPY